MKSNTEIFKLVETLRAQGCMPQQPRKTPRGALITIEQPTPDMEKHATEIKQCLNGVYTLVYALNWNGCTISWKGGHECQVH